VFTSVADLAEAITTWVEHWNADPRPFIWKATAEGIIAKITGACTAVQVVDEEVIPWTVARSVISTVDSVRVGRSMLWRLINTDMLDRCVRDSSPSSRVWPV
jgi:hypothetical protein